MAKSSSYIQLLRTRTLPRIPGFWLLISLLHTARKKKSGSPVSIRERAGRPLHPLPQSVWVRRIQDQKMQAKERLQAFFNARDERRYVFKYQRKEGTLGVLNQEV